MTDKENKYDSTDIVTENRTYNKLQNFWYHNKWTVIVVTFFVVVIAVCTLQMFGKDKYDVSIVYGGTERMEADERAAFVGALQDVLPEGARVLDVIEQMLVEKNTLTPDLGGTATTSEVGERVCALLEQYRK